VPQLPHAWTSYCKYGHKHAFSSLEDTGGEHTWGRKRIQGHLFVFYQIWCQEIAKAGIHPPTGRSEYKKIIVDSCLSMMDLVFISFF
jgi:hypothetical protein